MLVNILIGAAATIAAFLIGNHSRRKWEALAEQRTKEYLNEVVKVNFARVAKKELPPHLNGERWQRWQKTGFDALDRLGYRECSFCHVDEIPDVNCMWGYCPNCGGKNEEYFPAAKEDQPQHT